MVGRAQPLLDAVESKETKSAALNEILYIPEMYDEAEA